MSGTKKSGKSIVVSILGGIIFLSGLVLGGGGAYLAFLGGSWYYLIAGVLMVISGVQLMRQRMSGAYIYAVVLVGTLFWTAWESGLQYWRWVPRLGIILLLAVLVAYVSPRLKGGVSRRIGLSVASVLLVGLLIAGGLMFRPDLYVERQGSVPDVAEGNGYLTDLGDQLAADKPSTDDWPAYGHGSDGTRFSPLKDITPDNVKNLKMAWKHRSGDLLKSGWGTENTPLKVGDSLYVCTAHSHLIALNAKTGQEKWHYTPDPSVEDSAISSHASCRGVAYYKVPKERLSASQQSPQTQQCQERIIMGALDARLISVDAKTGKACPDFGNNGQVSYADHLGDTPDGYVSSHAAPVIVNNAVIVGTDIIDNQSADEPSGVIRAYDVVTGKPLWAWDAAKPDHSAPLTDKNAIYSRSSPNMWAQPIGDNQLGLVYLPLGNALPDYMSKRRNEGERKYSAGLVALDVKTGQPAWHFQTVHNDVWDYDLASQPSLVDFPTSQGKEPAIILPTKQGDIYVFNRKTGKPLGGGVEERPVPSGGIEPEERSPTQPFSQFADLRFPDLTEQSMWGTSPFDQLYCRIQYKQASYKGFYTPPTTDQPYIQYPSFNGGTDWGSLSVDPQRGVIIANFNNFAMYNQLIPRKEVEAQGWKTRADRNGTDEAISVEGTEEPMVGADYGIAHNTAWRVPLTGMPCTEPPYGGMRAIDLKSGKTLWQRPLGTARKNGPFDIESHLPTNIGTPNNGGSAITAGGLVFISAATDDLLRAIDIKTGKTVWSAPLPAGGQATPMVYRIDGKEYVVIRPTGHNLMNTKSGDYTIAFTLSDS